MTTHVTPTTPTQEDGKLAWSSRIEVNSLAGGGPGVRAPARASHQEDRPRTSRIEREIIVAVVVLYAGIIACFAGLHLFGVAQFG